jgi:hypothetical protein
MELLGKKGNLLAMSTAALIIIAKIWNQPRCQSEDEWIKNVIGVHSGMLFNPGTIEIIFAAAWMQVEVIISSEIKKPNTER